MSVRPLLTILLALTISSCEKNVNIPLPEESNKVVLNLIMNRDSAMVARVTLSGRLDGSPNMPQITNAVLNLYENGTFKETLTPFGNSGRIYYRGNTLPVSGSTYRITAAAPGYTEVSGSDQIPDTVEIGEIRMTAAPLNANTAKATVTVQLNDDPDVQNYYRVRIYRVNEWRDANGNGRRQTIQEFFEAEEASINLFNDNIRSEFFTTDALFNGRSPRFIFRTNTDGNFKQLIVEISTLTYNSYNYLNSVYMARDKNEDGLSEKVIVFNNIENGLGIVGGVAQRNYLLER